MSHPTTVAEAVFPAALGGLVRIGVIGLVWRSRALLPTSRVDVSQTHWPITCSGYSLVDVLVWDLWLFSGTLS
ncbi:hypothetical protein CJ179_17075 [Rhodococcus sp. ACS1]|nr:hypothetical protein CJ179_17075 [Rhodococcus sp. ACS1]